MISIIPEGLVTTNKQLYTQQQESGDLVLKGLSVGNPFFAMSMYLTRFLLNIFSLSVEIFLRVRFGERYLNNMGLVITFLLLITLAGQSRHISAPQPVFSFFGEMIPRHTWMTSWFLFWFLLVAVLQRGGIFWRNWVKRESHHSFAEGVSILGFLFYPIQKRLLFVPRLTQRFIEPLVVFLFASALPDPFLARWLTVSAFCLFIKEALTEQSIRGRYLDLVDATLEAQAVGVMATANDENQKPTGLVKKYKGFSVRVPPVARSAQQTTGGE